MASFGRLEASFLYVAGKSETAFAPDYAAVHTACVPAAAGSAGALPLRVVFVAVVDAMDFRSEPCVCVLAWLCNRAGAQRCATVCTQRQVLFAVAAYAAKCFVQDMMFFRFIVGVEDSEWSVGS